MKTKKILATILGFALSLTFVIYPVTAQDTEITYLVNSLKTTKNYILNSEIFTQTSEDLNEDGLLDISDVIINKQNILSYKEEFPITPSPASQLQQTTPTTGDINSIVFSIEFNDIKYTSSYGEKILSAKEIQEKIFSSEDTSAVEYPFESVTAFFNRASYGQLNIDGEVYSYTTKGNRADYENNYEKLVMEILDKYDDEIDFSQFDKNSDGVIDSLIISVPLNGNTEADEKWWGNTSTWYSNPGYKVDGMKIEQYIINDAQPTSGAMQYYNRVVCHEMGHAMGLPDYYHYDGSAPEGFIGNAGYEIMDDMYSDFCSFSKIILGWINDRNIQIADVSKSSQTFYLSPSDTTADAIIVPMGELDEDYFSEYFIIEYQAGGYGNNGAAIYGDGGVRIFHTDAEVIDNMYVYGKKMLKNENFSPEYVATRRVLQLVGDNGFSSDYYVTGDEIKAGTDHFYWYDTNNQETIDTGFTIKIGELTSDDKYTIEINR